MASRARDLRASQMSLCHVAVMYPPLRIIHGAPVRVVAS